MDGRKPTLWADGRSGSAGLRPVLEQLSSRGKAIVVIGAHLENDAKYRFRLQSMGGGPRADRKPRIGRPPGTNKSRPWSVHRLQILQENQKGEITNCIPSQLRRMSTIRYYAIWHPWCVGRPGLARLPSISPNSMELRPWRFPISFFAFSLYEWNDWSGIRFACHRCDKRYDGHRSCISRLRRRY